MEVSDSESNPREDGARKQRAMMYNEKVEFVTAAHNVLFYTFMYNIHMSIVSYNDTVLVILRYNIFIYHSDVPIELACTVQ